ncbi:hypothetical protein G7K_5489-t1 [Saitoella complicata NRRL Y-17804]|uniref:Uncharacterized protein n=1 Tax=Saitoella complicata (strain BCRC 22490 / CBS 7301 / JCM 7358 / NBRC 10748 / NRRL Y-17804) TaxID=698492 RepID=A0A0E9NNF2_SAICN|nr:hypothetical protein G7K_5489-t1 [Saitoella complicata NRRL Y-17804]
MVNMIHRCTAKSRRIHANMMLLVQYMTKKIPCNDQRPVTRFSVHFPFFFLFKSSIVHHTLQRNPGAPCCMYAALFLIVSVRSSSFRPCGRKMYSLLLSKSLSNPLTMLQKLIRTLLHTPTLLLRQTLRGEIIDTVRETALNEVGVEGHEVLHLFCFHEALEVLGFGWVHSVHGG